MITKNEIHVIEPATFVKSDGLRKIGHFWRCNRLKSRGGRADDAFKNAAAATNGLFYFLDHLGRTISKRYAGRGAAAHEELRLSIFNLFERRNHDKSKPIRFI